MHFFLETHDLILPFFEAKTLVRPSNSKDT